MDSANRLSLLALIVAIVALIVSAWQLAQQLFATATDGKRFCQASVMGIWARKTRLSWRWSQIRFETKYTTPEIGLTSGIWNDDSTVGIDKGRQQRFVYRLPVLGWLTEVFNGPASDWAEWFEVTSNSYHVPLELRKTRRPGLKPLLHSRTEAWSLWASSFWDQSFKVHSPDIVSWPSLLQRIYANEIRCVRKMRPEQQKNGQDKAVDNQQLEKIEKDGNAIDEDGSYAPITDKERQLGEDRVVVRLVERSWDLIPPDVVRKAYFSSTYFQDL